MDAAARADLKSDVLKDIEKQKRTQPVPWQPGHFRSRAGRDHAQLDNGFAGLNEVAGKAGPCTHRERLADEHPQPGGHSRRHLRFDLPAYYAWQHLDADTRRVDVEKWASTLAPLAESVHLLLKLLRDSGAPQKVLATNGQFVQTLPQGRTFQLMRLRIDPGLGLVPEISGNRLMVSVRLMRHGDDDRLHATTDEAAFEMTLCA